MNRDLMEHAVLLIDQMLDAPSESITSPSFNQNFLILADVLEELGNSPMSKRCRVRAKGTDVYYDKYKEDIWERLSKVRNTISRKLHKTRLQAVKSLRLKYRTKAFPGGNRERQYLENHRRNVIQNDIHPMLISVRDQELNYWVDRVVAVTDRIIEDIEKEENRTVSEEEWYVICDKIIEEIAPREYWEELWER